MLLLDGTVQRTVVTVPEAIADAAPEKEPPQSTVRTRLGGPVFADLCFKLTPSPRPSPSKRGSGSGRRRRIVFPRPRWEGEWR